MQRLMALVLIHYDTRGTRVLLRHPRPGDPLAAGEGEPGSTPAATDLDRRRLQTQPTG